MFDTITLKKNGIAAKIYKYTFGEPHWNNFCPFFWLTLLSFIAFPTVFLAKTSVWIFSLFYSKKSIDYNGVEREKIIECTIEKFARNDLSLFSTLLNCLEDKYNIYLTEQEVEKFKEKFLMLQEKYYTEKKEKEKQRSIKMAARVSKLKPFIVLILAAAVGTLGFFLYLGGLWVFTNITWSQFLNFLFVSGSVIAIVLITILILSLIINTAKKVFKDKIVCFWNNFCIYVNDIFSFIGSGLKNIKENHCPGIKWE